MATVPIRPAAVAGYFYPSDPHLLRMQVGELLARAMPADDLRAPPKALVVPHAGYMYSGAIAASGYAAVHALRHSIRRVVLLGPAHRFPVARFAMPASQAFATPLGEVPLSRQDWVALQQRKDVEVDDRAHAAEHSLEVQLPFLQILLDHFEIVPILVGDAPVDAVAELLQTLWGGPETLIVVSSDLSHYHTYDASRSIDGETVRQILDLRPTLHGEQACGASAVNGLLQAADRRGMEACLLDQRNSGDTAGDRSRVVGYASLAFVDSQEDEHVARH